MKARICLLLVCGRSVLLLGAFCENRGSLQAAEPSAVPVSRPVAREVTDYVDFTARTEAVSSVNVVARVTGYMVRAPFKEGSEVKAGELLFEIDPRPYQAEYDQALAHVDLSKAQIKLSQAALARDEQVARTTPGAVSPQQLDQDHAAVEQAEAQVKAAQAAMQPRRLDLDFCKVTSPIDGQAGRYYLTVGNLVTKDQTVLTTVVSLDPIYAYFDADEATALRIRRAANEGRIKPDGAGHLRILMGLQGEEGFPHNGTVDFVNNQVNPATGSLLVRGVFPNPLPPGGSRMLIPKLFTRIRLPIGQPHPALLVSERAILSDGDLKFVYVVNAQGQIERKRIETGSLESDGLRAITKGLDANDEVVVGGLQHVEPGMSVQSQVVPMPVLEGRKGADGSR